MFLKTQRVVQTHLPSPALNHPGELDLVQPFLILVLVHVADVFHWGEIVFVFLIGSLQLCTSASFAPVGFQISLLETGWCLLRFRS